MTACIVDLGINNLTSVLTAVAELGIVAEVAAHGDHPALASCSHLLLPGVGAYPRAMQAMTANGLDRAVRAAADRGVPVLGLCLGMQLLGEGSDEFGWTPGLGLLPGRVAALIAPGLRLPHVGWNEVHARGHSHLLEGLDGEAFYFVHNYAYADADETSVTALSHYGDRIVAIKEHGRVAGTQFHPEKSQAAGLRLLRNFFAPC